MTRLTLPTCLLLLAGMLLSSGCTDNQRTPADAHLGHYRYAVVTFPNHASLGDRAETVLASLGLIILDSGDARLKNPEVSKSLMRCDFLLERWSTGLAVSMVIHDDHGRELFHSRGKQAVNLTSVDAAVMALAPYRAADAPPAPAPGTIIEF